MTVVGEGGVDRGLTEVESPVDAVRSGEVLCQGQHSHCAPMRVIVSSSRLIRRSSRYTLSTAAKIATASRMCQRS